LTGHGCFNKYLLRFKKRENAVCMYCDYPNDDVEHTFIRCGRWWQERSILEVELGRELTPEMMVECMLQSKKKWDRVVKFITAVVTRKEVDERAVQSAAAAAVN